MGKYTLLFLLAILWGSSQAQEQKSYLEDPNAYQRERFVDFLHANISIGFQPDLGQVNGVVRHKFKPLRQNIDTLYLDGVNMTIKKVLFNDVPIEHKWYKKGITLVFPSTLKAAQEYTVTIEYSCQPRRGLYFIGWDDKTNRAPKQIWTQGQGIDNRHWVPLFDDMADKITTDILVQVNDSFQVLSNGELITKMNDNLGNKTWHYQMSKPHSPYLMMLGIGNYVIDTTTSSSGVPLYRYMYPQWQNRFQYTYKYDKDIFDFLEAEIGMPFPWNKYAQIPVQDFPYGAMENTSATIFGDFFCVDSNSYNDANYVFVNGHELAHQWFGDWVTSISPKHHWLHESFATYYHHLVVKEFLGENEFQRMMRDNQNAALNGSKKDFKGVGHSQAGSHRHYLKGSYVLKMLRYSIGDSAFKIGLQHYLQKHKLGNVTTDDLINAFAESTGHSIAEFVDQWVYRGGEPYFKVDFETIKKQGQHRFVIEQTQDTTPLVATFKMPVVLEVYYTDGSKNYERVDISSSLDTFYLPAEKKKKVAYALFDPGSEILKSVEFKKSVKWLQVQAIESNHMLDRYDALLALREVEVKNKEAVLHQIVGNKEEYYLVRGEALSQLEKAEELEASEVKLILTGNDVQLKKTVLKSVKKLDENLKSEYEQLLNAPSYELIEIALIRLCNDFPDNAKQYMEKVEGIEGTRGHNVLVTALEIKYARFKDVQAAMQLVDMCSNSFDFITRQKAMAALKRLNYSNDKLIINLASGVQKANWKLSSSSGNLLKHIYTNSDNKERIKDVMNLIGFSKDELNRVERFLAD